MLFRSMSFDITMAQCARGDHLGVETRALTQEAMKIPAMPICPIHHRRNTDSPWIGRFIYVGTFFLKIVSSGHFWLGVKKVLWNKRRFDGSGGIYASTANPCLFTISRSFKAIPLGFFVPASHF